MAKTEPCPGCQGKGKQWGAPCPICHGSGKVKNRQYAMINQLTEGERRGKKKKKKKKRKEKTKG